MSNVKAKLEARLLKLSGLEVRPSPVAGGTALFYNGREFAHFHSAQELDLRLTRKIIKEEQLEHPADSDFHPARSVNSPWIELRFTRSTQIGEIVRLVERAMSTLD